MFFIHSHKANPNVALIRAMFLQQTVKRENCSFDPLLNIKPENLL